MLRKLNEGRKHKHARPCCPQYSPTVHIPRSLRAACSFALVVFVRRIKAVIVPQCVFVIDRVISSFGIIRSLLVPRRIPRRSNLVL